MSDHDEYLKEILTSTEKRPELATLDISEIPHARLGASSSKRWMNCPGSLRLIGKIKERGIYGEIDTSDYAKEGTLAHALGEACLRNGLEPHVYTHYKLQEVTENMADAVQVYVDYCRRLMQGGGEYVIEKEFSLEKLDPPEEMFGTVDFLWWYAKTGVLEVVDYKHGIGIPVSPVYNSQLMMYALGAMVEMDIQPHTIITTVVQPRRKDGEKIVWSYDYTYGELIQFEQNLMAAANTTMDPDAPTQAGDWCTFCAARATCQTTHDWMQKRAGEVFDAVLPRPEEISLERVSELLSIKNNVYGWFRALKKYAEAMIESGEEIPGWKLVHGHRRKVWVNEKEAKMFLHSIGLNPTMAPVTAGTALGNALPRDLWQWEKGTLKLVPRRDAVDVFDAINPEDLV